MHTQLMFSEQDVDGDTLLMLSTSGTIEQLKACGFTTVKQQMMLKRLLSTTAPASGSITPVASSRVRKLKKKEINDLSPQDKSVYLMM